MRVTDASKIIGITAPTLRLWERRGLIKFKRDGLGRRDISERDIPLLIDIFNKLRHKHQKNLTNLRKNK